MSKKRSKSKSSVVKVKSLSPQSLAQSAASFYSAGDYKNALSQYERLYKEHPDESTKEHLISCLMARSKQLQQKQMVVEACALFAKLQILAPESLPVPDYINCLVKARYYTKAYALCRASSLDEISIPYETAVWLVAASAVSPSTPGMSADLFQNHRVLAHDAFTLLDTDPNSEVLMLQLKKISLRSPLKDLRLLIHSLLLFQTNQKESLMLAQEIKDTSPFFTIARVIMLASKPPVDLFMALADLSTLQLRLLQQLKGWSDKQLDVLKMAVAALVKQQNHVKKIKFIMQLQSVPENVLKQICWSLYDGNAATWRLLADRFGDDAFVRTQFKAIQAEKRNEPWDCIKPWDECISAIEHNKTLTPELIGLIKLHQYQVINTRCCPEHEECAQWLVESLDYLPARKATYTELCNLYAKEGNKKLHEKWLSNMQKQFPEDIEVLLNSATHSLQKKTYTKAITVLKKALEVDSINTRAKQLLAHTYFEKALYEVSKKKAKNATDDLKNAQSFQQYMHHPCFIPIGESFLAFCNNELSMMKERLRLAYQKAGNKLLVNYIVAYYLAELKFNAVGLRESLTWDNADGTAFVTLTQGLKDIRDYSKNHGLKKLVILEVHDALKQQIAAALKMSSTYEDFELLCVLFLDLKWYASLLLTAKSALKRHKKSGLFHYYQIQGEIKGDVRAITNKQYQALIHDLENLPDKERSKTAPLIAALLDEAERYRRPSFLDSPFIGGMPKSLSDLLGELFV